MGTVNYCDIYIEVINEKCQSGLLFVNNDCLSRYVTVEITPTAVTPWALG